MGLIFYNNLASIGALSIGNGATFSNAEATRKTKESEYFGPMICKPTGRLVFVKPHGTEHAGCLVKLKG